MLKVDLRDFKACVYIIYETENVLAEDSSVAARPPLWPLCWPPRVPRKTRLVLTAPCAAAAANHIALLFSRSRPREPSMYQRFSAHISSADFAADLRETARDTAARVELALARGSS